MWIWLWVPYSDKHIHGAPRKDEKIGIMCRPTFRTWTYPVFTSFDVDLHSVPELPVQHAVGSVTNDDNGMKPIATLVISL